MAQIADSHERYGLISRTFHWAVAVLIVAQLLSAAAHALFGRENPVRGLLWSYHQTLGATILALVVLRALWGLTNLTRRPGHPGVVGVLSTIGHVAMYLLMLAIPSIALIRAYGSGRGFDYLGLQLVPATGQEVAWMTEGLGQFHSIFGWTLAVLIAGHIVMAIYHTRVLRDGTLQRMTG